MSSAEPTDDDVVERVARDAAWLRDYAESVLDGSVMGVREAKRLREIADRLAALQGEMPPSEPMIEAGVKVLRTELDLSDGLLDDLEDDSNLHIALRSAYTAMRSAAPQGTDRHEEMQPSEAMMKDWPLGLAVEKTKGSSWHGKVVGYYSTQLTPQGVAVESSREPGSVQIYPVAALHAAALRGDEG